ncbi:MAG TPA: hypothetical protein VH084_29920 [Mycobacterium sp.]|jgi:hypothetical protein|nr:hypothetical protein [Mycobacterium sp.]
MNVAELQALLNTYDPGAQVFVYHGGGYDRYLAIESVEPMPYIHDSFNGEQKYGFVLACFDDGHGLP